MVRKLKNLGHFIQAFLAVIFYRFPASHLTVIGVTGTDGKTTTVHLVGEILKKAGFKVAMISTLGAWFGEKEIKTGFHVTTPSPFLLQKLLQQIVNRGFTHVVLEATSHGFDQHRLLGCNFKVGVITNITHEHLDYHKTFEDYLKAKAKLFRKVELAVLNCDDESYEYLKSKIKSEKAKIITYGVKNEADLTPKTFPFKGKLLGEYNLYNCLAAIGVAQGLGIKKEIIRIAVEGFSGLPGRLEKISEGQDFQVFIDFAHTPAAFKEVLKTVRNQTKGEIIHVFGCTGDRDKTKRPMMGEISAKLSDKIILTHEDTYHEDLKKIINEIEVGVKKGGKILGQTYWKIFDRSCAIILAINMAKSKDTVLITGVGHQKTLNLGGQEIPWSDQEISKEAIKERLK
ncbi:MAG: UDP-N-acetylmuramoyl-L-alanyl-D-glutamate--2,6-diaminopimelate ligase [Patescibacteria group bacterium]